MSAASRIAQESHTPKPQTPREVWDVTCTTLNTPIPPPPKSTSQLISTSTDMDTSEGSIANAPSVSLLGIYLVEQSCHSTLHMESQLGGIKAKFNDINRATFLQRPHRDSRGDVHAISFMYVDGVCRRKPSTCVRNSFKPRLV
eukprot:6470304-Amphidinium_carterae.1